MGRILSCNMLHYFVSVLSSQTQNPAMGFSWLAHSIFNGDICKTQFNWIFVPFAASNQTLLLAHSNDKYMESGERLWIR